MKGKNNLLAQLKPLPYFSKNTVYQLGLQLGLKDSTVDTYISRFLRSKDIIQLKNAVYVSAVFFNNHKSDISYLFYLANVIRKPSYISSWAALQYYDLATEAIHSITSVTLKNTRSYQTKAGNFSYHSIKKELFSDFDLVSSVRENREYEVMPHSSTSGLMRGEFDFFIASPAKALFDLLYFRTHQFRSFRPVKNLGSTEHNSIFNQGNRDDIKKLIDSLRVDFDEMEPNEREKFFDMINDYIHTQIFTPKAH